MTSENQLPVMRIGQVAARAADAEWMIESLWTAEAVGIIGGQPKLWKSWLCLDMAISVSSGTACLGRFQVKRRGPTLVFMAEDEQHEVRRRVDCICESRSLDVNALDLHLITSPRLYLDDDDDRDMLRRMIEQIQPKLLLLDPLVRLHRGNENDSRDIAALLGFLRELQRQYGCAVVLAHHASKRGHGRPGQGLRGSSDLHAFGSSNLYLAHRDGDVEITVEHRAAPSTGPYLMRLVDDGGTHLKMVEASAGMKKPPSLEEQVLDHLEDTAVPVARADLRSTLRVNNHRLGKTLTSLLASGQIVSTPEGLALA
ncbi:MAG: AAA family ATPase [Acidiferrobacteraceae bacterium]